MQGEKGSFLRFYFEKAHLDQVSEMVLSVVAQQVSQIMNALKEYEKNKDKSSFQLDSDVIPINDQFAIFITMNPGYAGRSELP